MAFNKSIILVLSLSSLLLLYVEGRSSPIPISISHVSQVPSSSPSSSPSAYKGPVPPNVQRICDGTEFPAVCINTILPLLSPTTNTDALSILQLGLKALTTETHKAIQQTKKLLNDSNTPPELEDCLNICLESYGAVLERNDNAISIIPDKDYVELEAPVDETITLIYDCDDAFTDLFTDEPPLEKTNEDLIKLAKNNVGFTNALTGKSN